MVTMVAVATSFFTELYCLQRARQLMRSFCPAVLRAMTSMLPGDWTPQRHRWTLHKRIHTCFPRGTTGYHNWTSVRFGSFVDQIYMNHETTWQDQLLESSYIMSWSRASDGANFSPKYTTSVLFHRMSERSWKNLHSAHFSWNHSGFSVFLSAFASLFHCVWAWRMRQGRGLWRCCQPANLPDPPCVRHVRCS